MQLTTAERGAVTLARPESNRLDAATAPALRSATADLANQGRLRVVLDLGAVDFVDSSGLGALIHMHKTLAGGGRLVLSAVSPKVTQLLKVTRLDRVFTVAATVEEGEKLALA